MPLGSRLEVETSHHFFCIFFSLLVKRLVGDFKGRQWTASWKRIRALNVFEKKCRDYVRVHGWATASLQ